MFQKLSLVFACVALFSVNAAMAQVDYCEGNFDYDRDQDGTDAFTFKSDFGRSAILNPCPGGFAAVAKTGSGQSQSVYGWDDGCLQEGVPSPSPRFTDHGNGTVTDNLTGLMWTKNADACSGTKSWTDAMDCVASQYVSPCYAGYCDWVLPNIRQLQSLVDFGRNNPALPGGHPFTYVQLSPYWSSTTSVDSAEYAWLLVTNNGTAYYGSKTNGAFVWLVRGGYDFLGKCAWE
jgi:hypothetical protein